MNKSNPFSSISDQSSETSSSAEFTHTNLLSFLISEEDAPISLNILNNPINPHFLSTSDQSAFEGMGAYSDTTCVSQDESSRIISRSMRAHTNPIPVRVNDRLVAKTYCKAIVKFLTESLADPYLEGIYAKNNINAQDFKNYVNQNRQNIGGTAGLQKMLIIKESDSEEIVGYKKAFQAGCEAFLKYFAVNWIFQGNLRNTKPYLIYRFKLLRQIRNPTLGI